MWEVQACGNDSDYAEIHHRDNEPFTVEFYDASGCRILKNLSDYYHNNNALRYAQRWNDNRFNSYKSAEKFALTELAKLGAAHGNS